MAAQKAQIRYFHFKIGLNSTIDLSAGDSDTLAASGQYKVHNSIDVPTYSSIISTVRDALLAGRPTVTLLVDGEWIVGVPPEGNKKSTEAANTAGPIRKASGKPNSTPKE